MKNQKNFQTELKEKTSKIDSLENQILDLKLSSGNVLSDIKETKEVQTQKLQNLVISKETMEIISPKLKSVIKGEKNALKAPPNDIQLELSSNNDEKMNNIIVSYKYY